MSGATVVAPAKASFRTISFQVKRESCNRASQWTRRDKKDRASFYNFPRSDTKSRAVLCFFNTGPRPPKGCCYMIFANTKYMMIEVYVKLCHQSKSACVCFSMCSLVTTLFFSFGLFKRGWIACFAMSLLCNMIYLTLQWKETITQEKTKVMPARITLLQPVYFFLNHKSTKNLESLIMNVIYDCHKKFTLLPISIYPAINQWST